MNKQNFEDKLITDFGNEWSSFDQINLSLEEKKKIFNDYFSIFPKNFFNKSNKGFDLGSGSGRWAYFIAPQVKELICIEPSKAIEISKKNLSKYNNIKFLKEKVTNLSIKDESMDFGYSLGVLHHIFDTEEALKICVKKLKVGAPFLLYLYYNLDNRPISFKIIYKISNFFRIFISKLPFLIKKSICTIIAICIYYPLARISFFLKYLNIPSENIPLSYYSDKSFYIMQNDSLDRFGTKIEKRYSKKQISEMMKASGLTNIIFKDGFPYWVSIGFKK